MSIRKHPDSGVWFIDFRTPGGERIRRSAGTTDRKAAQEYHDRVKADLWRQTKLGDAPEKTFEEAAVMFLTENKEQKDFASKARKIAYWRTVFAGRPISSLTSREISANLPTHFVRHGTKERKEISASTHNRYLAALLTMLNRCVEIGWLSHAPKIRKAKEKRVHESFLSAEEARRLINNMSLEWMRDACRLALATGMRADEVLGLEWIDVDLPGQRAWLNASKTKAGKARVVPLNDDAVAVLSMRKGKHQQYVITRDSGKRVLQIDKRALDAACDKAGIKQIRFHDLRHAWASWHAQNGTPLLVLKELGGWNELAMVQKYAHLAPSHLQGHANTVKIWASLDGPISEKKKAAL